MKKILFLAIIALASCQKEEVAEYNKCVKCVKENGEIWSVVCQDQLTHQTIDEYIYYWEHVLDVECTIIN